ncbi:MAG: urease accessory protein UreD, partial [Acetobacteraceae bacterium]|nr:urease accessory protein UreD [Acetobacteraceae bacterium]
QRALGGLKVAFKRRGSATVLDRLRQSGCLKVRSPRVEPDEWTTAVVLNTSGGITAGDRLESTFVLGPGAQASITSQAAERFYRALPNEAPAQVRARVRIENGAAAEWLPQETILFDGCAMDRRLEVELEEDADFLGLEMLVFGRAAMGETVRRARARDVIRVRRNGALVLHDAVRLDENLEAILQQRVTAGGARAMATLIMCGNDRAKAQGEAVACETLTRCFASAPRSLPGGRLSSAIERGVEAAASTWNGITVARILAPDGATLRGVVASALDVLRAPRGLPRVWYC